MSAVPPPPHTCGCLSGITSRQAAMLELAGVLEAIIWKVCEVRAVHEVGDQPEDAAIVDRMEKTQMALTRMRTFCQDKGWGR